jgi:hypothetical protein
LADMFFSYIMHYSFRKRAQIAMCSQYLMHYSFRKKNTFKSNKSWSINSNVQPNLLSGDADAQILPVGALQSRRAWSEDKSMVGMCPTNTVNKAWASSPMGSNRSGANRGSSVLEWEQGLGGSDEDGGGASVLWRLLAPPFQYPPPARPCSSPPSACCVAVRARLTLQGERRGPTWGAGWPPREPSDGELSGEGLRVAGGEDEDGEEANLKSQFGL